MTTRILVTGAVGQVGGVGGLVVEALLSSGQPVCALVRREDERAKALRATGAEVVVADPPRPADVGRALVGCQRLYFGMSVSPPYLEGTITARQWPVRATTWSRSSTSRK
jgi:uncharacterized protein YbjT (DUF2867 family)